MAEDDDVVYRALKRIEAEKEAEKEAAKREQGNKLGTGCLIVVTVVVVFVAFLIISGSTKSSDGRPSHWEFEDSVKNYLKDGKTAEFSDEGVFQQKAGNYLMCGRVRAQNSFGAFGTQRFIAGPSKAFLEEADSGAGIFEAMWQESCHDHAADRPASY